ncbi:hypothetical protein VTI28DRAFT_3331 [Corynascus sepedonium]
MPISEAATKPKVQYEDIPAELSFEEIIKNRAAPPCSLNDFMDYLVHVEHNAEPLQFFLWYWDYIERWSTLLPRQKALSPPWDPEKAANPRSHFIKYSHKRERSSKMSKVLAIMEMGMERVPSNQGRQDDAGSSISGVEISSPISSPVSSPIPSPTSILSPTGSIKPPDWQPFTIQPNRDELCRITRHYISPSGPRRLPLSSKDREACLGGVKHTTHPSALLPAFLSAEATLRARAHPAFVRWSRRNASAARLLFLRCLGTLLVALGFGLDVLLILLSLPPPLPPSSESRSGFGSAEGAVDASDGDDGAGQKGGGGSGGGGLSAYWRAVCVVLWWPGLTVLVAAARGVCIVLRARGRARQVRPWEGHDVLDWAGISGDGVGGGEEKSDFGLEGRRGEEAWREHKRAGTEDSAFSLASSAASMLDPLRKPSLQVFGPANDYSGEPWSTRYDAKSVWSKVFDETVVVQNKALVMWQDRTILFAFLWGGAGAVALTVISLFVPSGMF